MTASTHTFASARSIATIKRIRLHIEENETTTGPQLQQLLGIGQVQVSAYLRHMEHVGIVRCTVQSELRRGGSKPALWAINHEPVRDGKKRRVVVGEARNAGMWRDPLVAALFGEPVRAAV